MNFELDHIYHVYNRSNETVFYNAKNYEYFVVKIRKLIYPVSDILCWCLMPNHFHIMLKANEDSIRSPNEKHRPNLRLLAKNIGTMLSSYTQAINREKKRRGKLFAHNTEAKQITHRGNSYIVRCFHYIHENPKQSGLTWNLEEWPYSSYLDYEGLRKGTLCNMELMREILSADNR